MANPVAQWLRCRLCSIYKKPPPAPPKEGNHDGSISDEKVATAADPLLDAEAMRVVRMMPRWKAGIQNGKPCRTMVALPIVFDM